MKASAAPCNLKALKSIAEAAEAVGRSTATLRFYERRGIAVPIRMGADHRRWYLPEHIEAIRAYQLKHGRR